MSDYLYNTHPEFLAAHVRAQKAKEPASDSLDKTACFEPPKRELSMMAWIATEGGRKCPKCGKYATPNQLGYTGGMYNIGGVLTHISGYGHLPGYGCNRSQNKKLGNERA